MMGGHNMPMQMGNHQRGMPMMGGQGMPMHNMDLMQQRHSAMEARMAEMESRLQQLEEDVDQILDQKR